MATNLYLVRHAHSTYTSDERNRPLSERGYKDAEKVTELLKKEKIDAVLSSPYARAVQTVEGTAVSHGKEVHLLEDFKERTLTEGKAPDFEAAIEKVWADPDFSWEGGESNRDAQQRGIRGMKTVLADYENMNVVIGTHGNIMVLIMNYFDEAYGYSFWKQLAMPDVYRLSFEGESFIGCQRIWMDL
ncbi:histidine phosphatase family protein [Bacillus sp. SB49]|uniref:histidine phosphatase family protein n=1 Tax=Bacillus sp. SB49 TaxID=1071080 RepID=UPI0003F6DB9F|nr:histidine phosphatase family protein [Bacillus sp. SB49]QHT47937.1 histidine phosphatase family protein [Bacillus sp. SB49]